MLLPLGAAVMVVLVLVAALQAQPALSPMKDHVWRRSVGPQEPPAADLLPPRAPEAVTPVLVEDPLPRLVLAPGANKRYFVSATTGKPIYMAGAYASHTFQERSDFPGTFDFPGMLTAMASNWNSTQGGLAQHRLGRFWAWEDTINLDLNATPNPFVEDGPGGTYNFGPAGNCTLSNPDQPRFNQAYFDRMATRVAQAKAAGIYLSVMLFQPWSYWDKGYGSAWPQHWFHPSKNCNGINGSPSVGGGYSEGMAVMTRPPMKGGPGRTVSSHNTIWRIQLAYVKKVIDTIHSPAAGGGDNVIYEIANEGGDWTSDWQDDMINEIKAYEAQTTPGACGGQTCKAHLVGKTWLTCSEGPSTCSGNDGADDELTDSPADWMSLWQHAAFPHDDDPPVPPAHKVNMTDSDHGYVIYGFAAFTPALMWKHFFRGHNVWFLDDMTFVEDTTPATLASRRALGHLVAYADKVNMSLMVPQAKGTSTPANSGYSLVDASTGDYMALRLGSTLTFAVPPGTYSCEWFNIDTRVVQSCGTVSGTPGTQPFTNAVLLLKSPVVLAQTITSIVFITPPSDENVNTAMTPTVVVEVRDQEGLPYTTAPVAVEMRIFNNPGGVVVNNNTATTSTATGRASFPALSVNVAGTRQFRAVVVEGGVDVTDSISGSFVIVGPLAAGGLRQMRGGFLGGR